MREAIAFCHASLEHLIDPRLACIQALHPLAASGTVIGFIHMLVLHPCLQRQSQRAVTILKKGQ
jgi:hypothetical protein